MTGSARAGGHVFISYARQDCADVDRLQRVIEQAAVLEQDQEPTPEAVGIARLPLLNNALEESRGHSPAAILDRLPAGRLWAAAETVLRTGVSDALPFDDARILRLPVAQALRSPDETARHHGMDLKNLIIAVANRARNAPDEKIRTSPILQSAVRAAEAELRSAFRDADIAGRLLAWAGDPQSADALAWTSGTEAPAVAVACCRESAGVDVLVM